MQERTAKLALGLLVLIGALSGAADSGIALYWDADRESAGWRDAEWTTGGSGRTHYDTEVRRHGRASMRLDGVPEREIYVSSVAVRTRIDAGKRYVFRFWYRRVGDGGEAAAQILAHAMVDERRSRPLGWVQLDGAATYPLPSAGDWRPVEIPLGRFPGGTERIYLYFRVRGETQLWVDEVSVAEEGVTVLPGGGVPLRDEDYAGIRLEEADLPQNLVRNGGFEEGLRHWQRGGRRADFAVVEEGGVEGSACLHVRAYEFEEAYLFQRVRIDPRRRYRLSFRGRSDGLVGYVFTKVLRFDRHNRPRGWLGGEVLMPDTGGEWVERSGVFAPSPQTDNVVLYLRVADTIGEAFVDDLRLEPLPMEGRR